MRKRLIILVSVLLILVVISSIIFLIWEKSKSALVKVPTPTVQSDILLGFKLPETCLLTVTQSCFPRITFDTVGTRDRFFIGSANKDPGNDGGDLNKHTIQAILFGDQAYGGKLIEMTQEQINGTGIAVDYLVNNGYKNDVNPLVVSEIVKLLMQQGFATMSARIPSNIMSQANNSALVYSSDAFYEEFAMEVPLDLASYRQMFAMPGSTYAYTQTYTQLGKSSSVADRISKLSIWSPMQKALMLEFMIHFNLSDYQQFLTSFSDKVPPADGVYVISYVPSLPKPSRTLDSLRLTYCDPNKSTLRIASDCVQNGSGFSCVQNEVRQLCYGGYWIDMHTKYTMDPP